MVEGTPLLREHVRIGHQEFESLPHRHFVGKSCLKDSFPNPTRRLVMTLQSVIKGWPRREGGRRAGYALKVCRPRIPA